MFREKVKQEERKLIFWRKVGESERGMGKAPGMSMAGKVSFVWPPEW